MFGEYLLIYRPIWNRPKAEEAFPRTVDMSNFRFLAERMSRALETPILLSVLLLHKRCIAPNFALVSSDCRKII